MSEHEEVNYVTKWGGRLIPFQNGLKLSSKILMLLKLRTTFCTNMLVTADKATNNIDIISKMHYIDGFLIAHKVILLIQQLYNQQNCKLENVSYYV